MFVNILRHAHYYGSRPIVANYFYATFAYEVYNMLSYSTSTRWKAIGDTARHETQINVITFTKQHFFKNTSQHFHNNIEN